MLKKEYFQLSCRKIGQECDFMVRADTEQELLNLVNYHLCERHDLCSLDSELKRKIHNAIRGIWCEEGQCAYSPRTS